MKTRHINKEQGTCLRVNGTAIDTLAFAINTLPFAINTIVVGIAKCVNVDDFRGGLGRDAVAMDLSRLDYCSLLISAVEIVKLINVDDLWVGGGRG